MTATHQHEVSLLNVVEIGVNFCFLKDDYAVLKPFHNLVKHQHILCFQLLLACIEYFLYRLFDMSHEPYYSVHLLDTLLFVSYFLSLIIINSVHIIEISCAEAFKNFQEDLKILETISVR